MKLAILNREGQETGRTLEISDAIVGIKQPNEHAIYLAVKYYLASQRQGTHKTKERGEIRGSRKKLKRQKGTGTARCGDIKNPLFRGGGTVFGPRPRDHRFSLNKKVKILARKSAMTQKAKDGAFLALEPIILENPETKSVVSLLKKLSIEGRKTLFIIPEKDKNFYLSARNLQGIKVKQIDELHTYNILNSHRIVFVEGIEGQLNKHFGI